MSPVVIIAICYGAVAILVFVVSVIHSVTQAGWVEPSDSSALAIFWPLWFVRAILRAAHNRWRN